MGKFGAVFFEVKAVDGENPDGEFEAVLSAPTLDRDGEVIDERAFEPLPAVLPIHAFHDFHSPVAMAEPYYDDGVLKAKGVYDPDEESQRIRTKVGRSIRFMSVGFMSAERETQDGVDHIRKAELLEASFVSVPSNREAEIIMAKSIQSKVGARNSASDLAAIQAIHDASCALGAGCETKDDEEPEKTTDPEKAAAPAAASPASVPRARLAAQCAEAELLLLS